MPKEEHFYFKQFKINQYGAGLKITTDASIQGAWASPPAAGKILDIGCGTGLLSLMLAQRTQAHCTAVEIDHQSASLAKQNFDQSPWADKMEVLNTSIQEFAQACTEKFDYIICNPPFYSKGYKSTTANRNKAMHNDELPPQQLLDYVLQLLHPDGKFCVMWPPYEAEKFKEMAQKNGLFASRQLAIRHHRNKGVIRLITDYGFKQEPIKKKDELLIRDEQNQYTADYQELLRDYLRVF